MSLRAQRAGNQKTWTLENLKSGLGHFYKEHGRYPTAPEIDAYQYLPSSKTIERRFGGVLSLRKDLGVAGQHDFRTGKHSSLRAKLINKRAHETEGHIYELLVEQFGKEFVHREYFFTDDKRTRADFFVYDRESGFCVDVFYPGNKHNLIGCLNSKLKKYRSPHMRQYPVIYLQMNNNLTQIELNMVIKNKRNKLPGGQELMSLDSFKEFCKSRKPLKLIR